MTIEMPQEEKEVYPLQVREFPDDMLKMVTIPWVKAVNEEKFQELLDSFELTLKVNQALGLAGPQVGLPYRIIAIRDGKEALTLINPVITNVGDEEVTKQEGCLSFPGLALKVKRKAVVIVSFMNRAGIMQQRSFSDDQARAVQHEIDHLDGVVFIDRIPKFHRSEAMRKWRLMPRMQKQYDKRMQEFIKKWQPKAKSVKELASEQSTHPPVSQPAPATAESPQG